MTVPGQTEPGTAPTDPGKDPGSTSDPGIDSDGEGAKVLMRDSYVSENDIQNALP